MAAGPDRRRALAVWNRSTEPGRTGEVFGRLVDGRGRPLGPPVQISRMGPARAHFGHDAAVAYDPRRRRWLVVWAGRGPSERSAPCRRPPGRPEPSPSCRQLDSELYARLVDTRGRALGRQRRITRTGPPDRTWLGAHAPDVAYNARTGEFAVAFAATAGGFPDRADARMQRVRGDGRPTGPPRRANARRGHVAGVRIASDRRSGAYMLAFTRSDASPADRRVITRRLDARGRPRGGEAQLAPSDTTLDAGDVAAAGRGWIVAVTSRPFTSPPRGVLLARVDARGRRAGPLRPVPGSEHVIDTSPALAADGTAGALLAFIGYSRFGTQLHAVSVDRRARPRGRPFQVSRMGNGEAERRPNRRQRAAEHAALAPVGQRGFLAVWAGVDDDDRERREIYARRVVR